MTLAGFTGTTNLGSGELKVYEVVAGQTVAMRMQVLNGSTRYGLAVVNLDGTGIRNPVNVLSYRADPAWAARNRYFSYGPFSSNGDKVFNLTVLPDTPEDFYSIIVRIAGESSSRWGEEERVYLRVLGTPVPPTPTLTDPSYNNGIFSVAVATTSGFTYHLEAREEIASAWSVVMSVSGDGTLRSLSDPSASATHRTYRVRVE